MPKNKAPQEIREVAQIIVNLRGNPNQICVRYSSLKEASKQFDKLDAAMRKPITLSDGERDVVVLTGDTLTTVMVRQNIEAWSLLSLDDHVAMMEGTQRAQAAEQAKRFPVPQ